MNPPGSDRVIHHYNTKLSERVKPSYLLIIKTITKQYELNGDIGAWKVLCANVEPISRNFPLRD
ncbi:MAG TPA: hypothetical protein VKA87_01020 [Nitrososphaeraceae archaeon]|nr:hypothetical protein [Nitrososphaeraceae archaeon]